MITLIKKGYFIYKTKTIGMTSQTLAYFHVKLKYTVGHHSTLHSPHKAILKQKLNVRGERKLFHSRTEAINRQGDLSCLQLIRRKSQC